jgi:hypothetical protein
MKLSVKTWIVIVLVAVICGFCSMPSRAKELYTETSQPGESVDQFVVRIASKIRHKTKVHSAELCGAIVAHGDLYALSVRSSFSQNDCGFSIGPSTVATIHTHIAMSGNDNFGPGDYQFPGYLITPRAIRHQAGRGTERRLK